jgi:hypothetical protein
LAPRELGYAVTSPIEGKVTARLPLKLPVVSLVLDCVELYVAVPEMPPPPVTRAVLSVEVLSV